MFERTIATLLLLACLQNAFSDTIQLKDKSSVTGKILAEKRDQVVIDLGFTVLVVPKNQIAKVGHDDTPAPTPPPKVNPAPVPPVQAGSPGEIPTDLFQTARTPLSEKS